MKNLILWQILKYKGKLESIKVSALKKIISLNGEST